MTLLFLELDKFVATLALTLERRKEKRRLKPNRNMRTAGSNLEPKSDPQIVPDVPILNHLAMRNALSYGGTPIPPAV